MRNLDENQSSSVIFTLLSTYPSSPVSIIRALQRVKVSRNTDSVSQYQYAPKATGLSRGFIFSFRERVWFVRLLKNLVNKFSIPRSRYLRTIIIYLYGEQNIWKWFWGYFERLSMREPHTNTHTQDLAGSRTRFCICPYIKILIWGRFTIVCECKIKMHWRSGRGLRMSSLYPTLMPIYCIICATPGYHIMSPSSFHIRVYLNQRLSNEISP